MIRHTTNWAGNQAYRAVEAVEPESTAEVADAVRRSPRVKALGTRHCFNRIADTDGTHVSLRRLNRLVGIDAAARTCRIGGGAQYSDFCDDLDAAGFALANLASLANVSVAGACATATHGSGVGVGSLATQVCGIEIVDGRGEVVELAPDDPRFEGAVVNLGALGIVTALTLRIEERYEVRQDAFENLPYERLREEFPAIMAGGDSVSLYTGWRDRNIRVALVKRRVRTGLADLSSGYFGATPATRIVGSLGQPDERRSPQMGIAGAWHLHLPHFRPDHRPPVGNELQSEYYVRPADAADAFDALSMIAEKIAAVVVANEIRAVAADRHWLSPFHGRDMIGFHFTWQNRPREVDELLPEIERVLAPFDAVPHWGKLFATDAAKVRSFYPRFGDFVRLQQEFDPSAKFANDFTTRFLTGD